MVKLPRYLKQRKLGLYAEVEIPKPLRPLFDNKARLVKSLQTRDQRIAERRLSIVVAGMKAEIEKARGGSGPMTGLKWEIEAWRETLEKVHQGDLSSGDYNDLYAWLDGVSKTVSAEAAQEAKSVLLENAQSLQDHLDGWFATIAHLDEKTQSLQKLAVSDLCGYFKTNIKINKESIKEYLFYLRTDKNLSDKTITIRLSAIRSFIRYMDEKFGTELLPLFTSKIVPKAGSAKTAKQRAWIPFLASDVTKLYEAALAKKKPDQGLADLIAFGAYTGCRIEELAQLHEDDLGDSSFKVTDSKTAAGIREVPIHAALLPIIKRLKEQSEDGFLLDGSSEGSFGKRSDALGKRFGKLKTSLGYGPQHVFHSVRKTVVSQLEQGGINENTTADIVGHDKPRITYGLYSAGASLKQKAEALAHVTYEGALAKPK